eukprot:sb/3478672/
MSVSERDMSLALSLSACLSFSLYRSLSLSLALSSSPHPSLTLFSFADCCLGSIWNFKHDIETSSFYQTFSWTPRNVTSNLFRHYSNFRFRAPLTLTLS